MRGILRNGIFGWLNCLSFDSDVKPINISVEMEPHLEIHLEDPVKKPQSSTASEQSTAVEVLKKSSKMVKPSGRTPTARISSTVSSIKKRTEGADQTGLRARRSKSTLTKSAGSLNAASWQRRNSTGCIALKLPSSATKRQENGTSIDGKKKASSVSQHGKRRSLESRLSLLPSVIPKVPSAVARSETLKSSPVSRLSSKSDSTEADLTRKPLVKPSTVSSLRRFTTSSVDSPNGCSSLRKVDSNVSSPSGRSPSVTSSFKLGSMSASIDRGSSLSGRKKTLTPESCDSRFMMLSQVDVKAGVEMVSDEVTCVLDCYITI